jgi:GT2 family glycosyltransferase
MFPRWWGFDLVARASPEPVASKVVPGTCLMVRRDVFAKAGLFNSAYFMYAEDVDLCCRARKLGWKTYYLHDAVVIHHGGRSSQLQGDGAFPTVLMRESVWKFLLASRGRAYAAMYRATTAVAAAGRLLVCGGLWLAAGHEPRSRWQAGAQKWTRVLRWSLGLEGWARTLGAPRRRPPPAIEMHPAVSPRQSLRA